MPRWLPWLLPLVGLALAAPALWRASPLAGSAAAEDATRTALAQGNRLVRDGELENAVEAYHAGWDEAATDDLAGLLAYNLGTTLHRLDRRPEALLWYRRAQPLRPGDRWLADNLALVRAELAAPRRPPPGVAARLAAARQSLAAAAVAAAWAALALLALRRVVERTAERAPGRRWRARAAGGGALALGVASLLLWMAPSAAGLAAPRPAVLLATCPDEAEAGAAAGGRAGEAGEAGGSGEASEKAAANRQRAEAGEAAGAAAAAASGQGSPDAVDPLPPGSEVWVRSAADGGWRIAGEPDRPCPGDAVALVAP